MVGKEKKKKEKQFPSNDKEAKSPESWPDLPQQLIHLIARETSNNFLLAAKSRKMFLIPRKSSLLENICSKGVTKSWRTEPNKCRSNSAAAWLVLSSNYGSDNNEKSQIFNMPIKKGYMWYYRRRRGYPKPKPPSGHFISRGQIVAGASSRDPVTDGYWGFPLWDSEFPIIRAALSSPLPWRNREKTKCTVMVLTGRTHPAFAYYRIWRREWIKKDSTIVDPNCSDPNRRDHLLQFTNGIWCREKFYALSLQGTLAVIEEDIDFDFRITALCKQRAVPSVSCKHFKEFLVESEGKIFLAFLISRNSINMIDYVEVYELNTHNLTWIKKESIGERTLFLGVNCCMSVSASRVGCRGNCIYFSHNRTEGWCAYEMETATISSLNNISSLWAEPIEVE